MDHSLKAAEGQPEMKSISTCIAYVTAAMSRMTAVFPVLTKPSGLWSELAGDVACLGRVRN